MSRGGGSSSHASNHYLLQGEDATTTVIDIITPAAGSSTYSASQTRTSGGTWSDTTRNDRVWAYQHSDGYAVAGRDTIEQTGLANSSSEYSLTKTHTAVDEASTSRSNSQYSHSATADNGARVRLDRQREVHRPVGDARIGRSSATRSGESNAMIVNYAGAAREKDRRSLTAGCGSGVQSGLGLEARDGSIVFVCCDYCDRGGLGARTARLRGRGNGAADAG